MQRRSPRHERTFFVASTLLALALLQAPSASMANTDDRIREAGDVLQIALPVAAISSSMLLRDWDGSRQYVYSFGTAWSVTYAFKFLYGKLRPDSGARNSWPSGHTMGAFSGAAFIYTRYGRIVGIPSYLLAGFTGYSRVRADKHFMDDVVAGASISMLSNWYHVTPGPKRLTFAYLPVEDGHVVSMRLRFGGGAAETGPSAAETDLRFASAGGATAQTGNDMTASEAPGRVRYQFAFGPAFLGTNRVLSAKGDGTEIRLEDFEKIDDPTTTSGAGITVKIHPRHMAGVFFWPFESRDFARLVEPLPTQTDTLAVGTRLRSIYRMIDLRFQYRFGFFVDSPWDVRLGADLALRNTQIRFEDPGSSFVEEESDLVALPLVALDAGYRFTPSIKVGAFASGIDISTDQVIDTAAYFGYRFNRHWEGSIGYQYYSQIIDTNELFNKARYHVVYTSVTHTF